MDSTIQDNQNPTLPFNNLYLNSGFVHGYNKLWMYVFTILLTIGGYVTFQLVTGIPLITYLIGKGYTETEIINENLVYNADALGIDKNIVVLLLIGMFVFAFMGFYVGIRFFHGKTLTSVLTGFSKFRYKRFVLGFSIWAVLVVVGVLAEFYLAPENVVIDFDPKGFFISVLIMILFMPIQTGIEELIFRGYLIQGLSQVFKNGIVPLILTTTLFGLAHMTNPEVKQYGWLIMFPYYTVFALFLGTLTLLDEGLELAFGIHFANNLVSSIMVSSPHSALKTYSIFQAKTEDPYSELIVWFIMATITFLILWRTYKWKQFNLIIK